MRTRLTPTLGLCLLAGLGVGAALALPAGDAAPSAPAGAPGYGQPIDDAGAAPGHGPPTDDAGAPAAASAGQATITIADFDFGAQLSVSAGQEITVVNGDGVAHTLTAGDGSFDTAELGGGSTASISAPAQTGTYAFFCRIHPSMTGSVRVSP